MANEIEKKKKLRLDFWDYVVGEQSKGTQSDRSMTSRSLCMLYHC